MATRKQQAETMDFGLSNFVAGAILPEGDYLFTENRVVIFDYAGKGPEALALKCTLCPVVNGKPDEAAAQEQHYTIGKTEDFQPNEDGTGIVKIGTKSLSRQSNVYIHLENLVNAGFPEDKLGNDFSVFDGMIAHVVHIPAPKREGLKSNLTSDAGQPTRERTIPVVSSIIKLPWDKSSKASQAKGNAKPAANEEPEENSDEVTLLTEHLMGVLEKEPKGMARTALRVGLFKSMSAAKVDTKLRDACLKLLSDDEVLEGVLNEVGFTIDGSKISPVG